MPPDQKAYQGASTLLRSSLVSMETVSVSRGLWVSLGCYGNGIGGWLSVPMFRSGPPSVEKA